MDVKMVYMLVGTSIMVAYLVEFFEVGQMSTAVIVIIMSQLCNGMVAHISYYCTYIILSCSVLSFLILTAVQLQC